VAEVPSFERSRYYGTSNLNAVSDGLRVLRTIQAERKRGVHRTAMSSADSLRVVGASWSVLSTFAEEAS
jgi:phage gp37-like protein